jgi:hypothetical protein
MGGFNIPWDPEAELKPVLDWLQAHPDKIYGWSDRNLLTTYRL